MDLGAQGESEPRLEGYLIKYNTANRLWANVGGREALKLGMQGTRRGVPSSVENRSGGTGGTHPGQNGPDLSPEGEAHIP